MKQDRILLQRIANKDKVALAELYRTYQPRVLRFIANLVRDSSARGEIVNDVFMVIWLKAATFRGNAAPSTWILGIAYKKAIKWSSRQHPQDSYVDNLLLGTPAESLVEMEEFHKTLDLLSTEQRAVIELTYFFGYSYHEISGILGCPENTVKTRMFHARRKLREFEQRKAE